jgi:transposase
MTKSIITAGIDTAKAKLDIAIHDGPGHWQVDNTEAGWRQLAVLLRGAGVERVGIEATGGYERGAVGVLRRFGFTVIVIQPAQVKAYARLHKQRAKKDRIDAELIAGCAAELDPPAIPPDERLNKLALNLTYLEQIEEDIARLKVRLEHVEDARVRRTINADIKRLKARRASEMARIAGGLRAHADLARRLELVASVDGIGERTALAVVVRMPELGQISREEAAALAGLAGGRARLRRSLYAAALPAAFRWNRALKDLYQRLTARGKSHQVALTACARKLLIYANTVVRRDRPWSASAAA